MSRRAQATTKGPIQLEPAEGATDANLGAGFCLYREEIQPNGETLQVPRCGSCIFRKADKRRLSTPDGSRRRFQWSDCKDGVNHEQNHTTVAPDHGS